MGTSLPKTMRAVAVTHYGTQLEIIEAPVPKPKFDEILIQVHASGLCSTDLHLLNGRQPLGSLPRILGHEIAGDIVALGSNVNGWLEGDRVTVAIDVACGHCFHCRTGQTQRCQKMTRIGFERDGGHADFVAVPASNLVKIPGNVSYEDASILPDAVACIYHSMMHQGKLTMGQTVVILGVGGLGIHGAQIGVLAGARVIATSRRLERLNAAKKYGVIPVNTSTQKLEEVVMDLTNGQGVDMVVDNIGNSQSVAQGLSILRPGGKFLVVAYLDEFFQVPSMVLLEQM
jgi:propanol-preferring alcohol dehydrogenase